MPTRNILASGTTDSVVSKTFNVESTPKTVSAFGTLGSDTGDLEKRASDGTWHDVYDGGTQTQVSATNPQFRIIGRGTYRVSVGTRTAAWGIDLDEG